MEVARKLAQAVAIGVLADAVAIVQAVAVVLVKLCVPLHVQPLVELFVLINLLLNAQDVNKLVQAAMEVLVLDALVHVLLLVVLIVQVLAQGIADPAVQIFARPHVTIDAVTNVRALVVQAALILAQALVHQDVVQLAQD